MPTKIHTAAAEKSGFNQVKQLLEEKPSRLHTLHTQYQTQPIEFAAQSGSVQTIEYLIAQGATLDASNKYKRNLLQWAVDNSPEVIEYITHPDNGIVEKFNDGTTYFHAAIVAGRLKEVMDSLNDDPTLAYSSNQKKQSALYWSIISQHPEITDILIKNLMLSATGPEQHSRNIEHIYHCAEFLFIKCNEKKAAIQLLKKLDLYLAPSIDNLAELFDLHATLASYYITFADYKAATAHYNLAAYFFEKNIPQLSTADYSMFHDHLSNIKNILSLCSEASIRGLRYVNVEGDGACFYHATSHQLAKLNNPVYANLDSQALREIVVQHMRANIDEYKYFIASENSNDDTNPDAYIDKYLNDITESDYWTDHLAITALSRELKMTFVILRNDGEAAEIIKQNDATAILTFGYLVGLHYVSLVPFSPTETLALLQTEIDKQLPDDFNGKILHSFVPTTKVENTTLEEKTQTEVSLSTSMLTLTNSFSLKRQNPYDEEQKEHKYSRHTF